MQAIKKKKKTPLLLAIIKVINVTQKKTKLEVIFKVLKKLKGKN